MAYSFVKDCINYIEGKKLNQMFMLNFLYFHDKLDVMDQLLGRCNLPKLMQEEVDK